MLFNSLEFFIFFPIVTILFYLLPHAYRWVMLLIASCYFYMSFIPEYILVLFATIIIDYVAAILIARSTRYRKTWLVISIVATCVVLIIFKYYNFFTSVVIDLLANISIKYDAPYSKLALPIGLSFHTFQSLSYVIEVYRGRQNAEKHFGIYSLYVMFYPQLVTGPIERPYNLLNQLREKIVYSYNNLVHGLRLILFGLAIKMVIADNMAIYVDKLYSTPANFHVLSVLAGLVLYSFQIYCDFYGYSTIALGAALAMGYRLIDNFKQPYFAQSIGEFWQRWHISLSTWFRDYVYIPLGGNKASTFTWIRNILFVFALSGLWHGANWTFIVWGLAHGASYLIESFIKFNYGMDKAPTLCIAAVGKSLRMAKTFLLVTFIWIFFRATSMNQAWQIFTSLKNNWHTGESLLVPFTVWLCLFGFLFFELIMRNKRFDTWCGALPIAVRWFIYALLIFVSVTLSGVQAIPFIYFQF